ncbi:reverse transcriptase domain-containing protein [Nephila pilipes]|uniref:Reverse transcriptase domain-containing protein n=1 Tax=Nephila pilipes TaxID=299642 RepID=A0A8X6R155_NEPPI|nr:reverse transcriptase domain-containing protein [Nephila pilipes]
MWVEDQFRISVVFICYSFSRERGPALKSSILDVLLQFRKYQYAFSSDIQGAFLTIGFDEKDRDYLRFFWFRNENDLKSYKILRMTRVPFGGYRAHSYLQRLLSSTFENIVRIRSISKLMLNSALYVDDLFYGANTVDKALKLSQSAVEILKEANKNLRKFKMNSNELRSLWRKRGISEARESNEHPIKDNTLIIICPSYDTFLYSRFDT